MLELDRLLFFFMQSFKDLVVWQKSRILVKEIYILIEQFPKEERYGFVDQIKRSAVSIPSNIAEWCARDTDKEQFRFFSIARWSCAELETQILIAQDLWFVSSDNWEIICQIEEISKMLSWLLRLKRSQINSPSNSNSNI